MAFRIRDASFRWSRMTARPRHQRVVAFDFHAGGDGQERLRPRSKRRSSDISSSTPSPRHEVPAGAVVGKPITSAHQSKTLEPEWREVHEFDVEDGSLSFKCVVEDYDALSKADHMGDVTVALSELPPQKVVRKWHSLGEDKGEVELVLQWCWMTRTATSRRFGNRRVWEDAQ